MRRFKDLAGQSPNPFKLREGPDASWGLIEVHKKRAKEIRTEVDAFVEVDRRAQDLRSNTEVGTKEAESPIADMPTQPPCHPK